MMGKRRTFTREFKVEAVKLITDQGLSFAEAARKLGITDGLPRKWKQALEARGRPGVPGARQPHPRRGGVAPPAGREQAAPGRAGHLKKSDGLVRHRPAVMFRFIHDHKGTWPVRLMCRVLGVSAGGYYD